MVPIAETDDRHHLSELTLALVALGIPFEVTGGEDDEPSVLWVSRDDAPAAHEAVVAIDLEADPRWQAADPSPSSDAAPEPPSAATDAALFAVAVALALALAFVASGGGDPTSPLVERGTSSGAALARGELWRAVTAITLHADGLHLLANLALLAVLGPLAARRAGAGWTLTTFVAGGAVANLVSASLRDRDVAGLGASGSIFALAGLLAGLRATELARPGAALLPGRARRAVVGAAVALLAWLGMHPGSDVVAHATGLVAGALAGVALGRTGPDRTLGRRAGLVSLASVTGAWAAALALPRLA